MLKNELKRTFENYIKSHTFLKSSKKFYSDALTDAHNLTPLIRILYNGTFV